MARARRTHGVAWSGCFASSPERDAALLPVGAALGSFMVGRHPDQPAHHGRRRPQPVHTGLGQQLGEPRLRSGRRTVDALRRPRRPGPDEQRADAQQQPTSSPIGRSGPAGKAWPRRGPGSATPRGRSRRARNARDAAGQVLHTRSPRTGWLRGEPTSPTAAAPATKEHPPMKQVTCPDCGAVTNPLLRSTAALAVPASRCRRRWRIASSPSSRGSQRAARRKPPGPDHVQPVAL